MNAAKKLIISFIIPSKGEGTLSATALFLALSLGEGWVEVYAAPAACFS